MFIIYSSKGKKTLRTGFAITASVGYVLINALLMCFKLLMKMCLSKTQALLRNT